jgi:hypothetical protein
MTKFRDRYVLGEGYPLIWAKRIEMFENLYGSTRLVELEQPRELTANIVPKYRLVLERVEDGS